MKAQIKVSVNTLPMPKSFVKFAGDWNQEAGVPGRSRKKQEAGAGGRKSSSCSCLVLLLLTPGCLEVQPQSKLELSRVKSGGRATAVTTIAGSLTKSIYFFCSRTRCGLIEAVEQIEALSNHLETQTFA